METFKKRCLLLFIFLALPLKGYCGELVLFIVCDTMAINIEDSVYHDLENVRQECLRISEFSELPLREIAFTGGGLNPESVFKELKGFSVSPDDLVIFYFSGHGYRTDSKGENPWPNLLCSSSRTGIDYGKVVEILLSKQPRFLLAIADCCNHFMSGSFAPPVPDLAIKSFSSEQVRLSYRKLFLESEGAVLVTSSEVGEMSWCIPRGALFTLSLIDSLKIEAESPTPSWELLLERASLKVKGYQHPFYLIHTGSAAIMD
jgi:hypothetical protein